MIKSIERLGSEKRPMPDQYPAAAADPQDLR